MRNDNTELPLLFIQEFILHTLKKVFSHLIASFHLEYDRKVINAEKD